MTPLSVEPGPAYAAACAGPAPVRLVVHGVTAGGFRLTEPTPAEFGPSAQGGAPELRFPGRAAGVLRVIHPGVLCGFSAESVEGVVLLLRLAVPRACSENQTVVLESDGVDPPAPPVPDWFAITRGVAG